MKLRKKSVPKEGDVRYRKRFALLPISAGLDRRWLETVYIEQRYWILWQDSGWENLNFLTQNEYLEKLQALNGKSYGSRPKVKCSESQCDDWDNGYCRQYNPNKYGEDCIDKRRAPRGSKEHNS